MIEIDRNNSLEDDLITAAVGMRENGIIESDADVYADSASAERNFEQKLAQAGSNGNFGGQVSFGKNDNPYQKK